MKKKKQNLKGDKSVLHLVSHYHIHAVYQKEKYCKLSSQFQFTICLQIPSENVFNSLEIFIDLEDSMNWGKRRGTETEEV